MNISQCFLWHNKLGIRLSTSSGIRRLNIVPLDLFQLLLTCTVATHATLIDSLLDFRQCAWTLYVTIEFAGTKCRENRRTISTSRKLVHSATQATQCKLLSNCSSPQTQTAGFAGAWQPLAYYLPLNQRDWGEPRTVIQTGHLRQVTKKKTHSCSMMQYLLIL